MKIGNLAFEESAIQDVLELFGKTTDKEGILLRKTTLLKEFLLRKVNKYI